jgi:hypothetical protein
MNRYYRNHFNSFNTDPFFTDPFCGPVDIIDSNLSLNKMMQSMNQSHNNSLDYDTSTQNQVNNQNQNNYTYSSSFISSYTNQNGQKRSKTIREISKNGQTYREVVETDGDKKTVQKSGPESLLLESTRNQNKSPEIQSQENDPPNTPVNSPINI